MNKKELAIIKQLDNGTLYAAPSIVEKMCSFYDTEETKLLTSHDESGVINGYIPVRYGDPDDDEEDRIYSYISGPPSISATYTPGAEHVLPTIIEKIHCYRDEDIVAHFNYSELEIGKHIPTASAYCLELENYLSLLSASRRKDFRRKLKAAERFTIVDGSLDDIKTARPWIEQRRAVISECTEGTMEHISNIIEWLSAIDKLQRARLKIDKYLLNGEMVGINCCVVHTYDNHTHCDDYLTWHDPTKSPGLGIVSAIKNITNSDMKGVRYNLGTPTEFSGEIIPGFAYKWDLIPESIRLEQSIIDHGSVAWLEAAQ